MPYEFKFIEEPHVALVTFIEKVTQEDFDNETKQNLEALSRCTGMYYNIIDLTHKPVFAFNILKSSQAMEVIRHKHFGWGIIIGSHTLGNFWIEMLSRIAKVKFKVFPTHEEALNFVETMRRLEQEEQNELPTSG